MASLVTEPGPLLTLPGSGPARRRPMFGIPLVVGVGDLLASLSATLVVVATSATLGEHPTPAVLLATVPVVWALCVGALRGYEDRLLHAWVDEVRGVVEAGLVLTVVAVGAATWWDLPVAPSGFLHLTAATVAGSLFSRAAVRAVRRLRSGRDRAGARRLVVVGRPLDVEPLVAELRRSPAPGLAVVTASPADFRAEVDDRTAAVVAVPCPELDPLTLRRIGWELEDTGTELFVTAGLVDVTRARAAVVAPGTVPLLHVRRSELTGGRRFVKDVAERVASALALVVLAPVLLAVATAIRLDSSGPALFRQVRVGRNGTPFTMLKFRTMQVDAERLTAQLAAHNEADGVLFKMRDDPRVTRLGRVLRKFSVDEFPQLLNVVLGQMSLVGPRPPLPAEVVLYESDVRRRFAVKPGVTGLWQVSGRSDLSWEDAVRLDLRYVDNWSLGSDLRILARTVRAVLGRDGAY